MKTVFIYALKCPITGRIRYVGKSKNPKQRLRDHIKYTKRRKNHVACWIRSLLSKEQRPILEILDEVPEEHWPQWEAAYIEYFREQGFDLVNSTPGGDSPPSNVGRKQSSEVVARRAARQRGKKLPPEHCAAISASKVGNKHPNYGKKLPKKTCENISAALTGSKNPRFGKKCPPEVGEKISAANLGRKHKDNISGFAGISKSAWHGKWQATFRAKRERIYVGYFSKIEDAVFARALAMAIERQP